MLTEHPTAEDFEVFLGAISRTGSATRNSQIVYHLLTECDSCREQLEAMGWSSRRLERLLYLPGSNPFRSEAADPNARYYDYTRAFAKMDETLQDFLSEASPMEKAPAVLWRELEGRTADEQLDLMNESRYAHPQMVRWLIDKSHAARYEDPSRMLHLADLARLAAETCTTQAAGNGRLLADLRTRAWGHFGNSLRVCGRLQEAEEALATAHQYRQQGTGDPPLRARLLEQMASLHTFQRKFDSAIELAQQAGEIYRVLGETHLLAGSLVQKAIALLYSGDPERAVGVLNRAIPMIDCEGDPHLLLAACHNLVRCYIDLEMPEEALSLHFETRDMYREFNDSLILLRATWQEGQLLRDLGHLKTAETALLQARKGFVERNLAYEVAVVSLDLAAVYIKLRAVESLQRTVVETVPIFRALRVDRDALASLLQLQQIADQEHQALELIRILTSRLEKLNRLPAK